MKRILLLTVLALSLSSCATLQSPKSFDLAKCVPLLQLEPAVQAAILTCVEQKP